jgi:hypothetical protein
MDPAFYNAANAIQVSPTTGNPIAGSGDSLNGTVLWGDGFTADAKNHVPIAASGQYDNLFHDLPRGYITPTGLRRGLHLHRRDLRQSHQQDRTASNAG